MSLAACALLAVAFTPAFAVDLLGGGGSQQGGNAAGQAAQQAAAQATQNARRSIDALGRASQAIQDMRAGQDAARALARQGVSPVPNGLQPGGLVVAPGAVPGATDGGAGLWQGADLPTEAPNGDRTTVTVKQNEQKAILTWQEFNVGRETDLYFNQTAGGSNAANWIALNRVLDPLAAPSQILGSIKAEGQVYVINRNGIIFGGASQVNVGTLVASSLSLSNQQFLLGINERIQIERGAGTFYGMPTFGDHATQAPNVGLHLNDPNQVAAADIGPPPGSVTVERGAVIETAIGGKAMLFAPHVTNAGTIRTPEGQAILAAGEQVWLMRPTTQYDTEYAFSTLRGFDVAVSAPSPYLLEYFDLSGGSNTLFSQDVRSIVVPAMEQRAASVGYKAVNAGVIEAPRGNITMQAREVVQDGALLASTALNNQDGSITLRAWGQGIAVFNSVVNNKFDVLHVWSPGTLTIGAGSVTTVMPDLSDSSDIELSALSERYRAGSVDLRGYLVNIESGASIVVPSGTITAVASSDPFALPKPNESSSEPIGDGSRIYIGENAFLSVAGLLDVLLSMESNVIEAEFRINELRDSPLYRDSWLRGLTVYVDKRESGAFEDGPMAGVEWVQDERGNIIPGAWVGTPLGDLSAWIGTGKTTLAELSTEGGEIRLKSGGDLIARQGSLLDVSGGSVRYQDGWVKTTQLLGADGRVYDISDARPDMVFVGIAGDFNRWHSSWGVTKAWTNPMASGGRFEEGYTEGRAAGSVVAYSGGGMVLEGDLYGGVITGERQADGKNVAQAGTLQLGGAGDADRPWLISSLVITSDPVKLAPDFAVVDTLPTGFYDPSTSRSKQTYLDAASLNASEMGSIVLFYNKDFTLTEGTELNLSPGASLTVAENINEAFGTTASVDGTIRIVGGSVLIQSGTGLQMGAEARIDVSGTWVNDFAAAQPSTFRIDGGSISLEATTVDIQTGAVLDVSGGARLSLKGLKAGDAGSIILVNVGSDDLAAADLRGYAAGAGGSLEIRTAADVQIGGVPTDPAMLHLTETLYSERGFRSLRLDTAGDVTIPDGVSVAQIPVSVDLAQVGLPTIANGTPITDIGQLRVLDLPFRIARDPTAIIIDSDKAISIGLGVSLTTDVGGSIQLKSAGSTNIDGTIDAPAGSVTVEASIVDLSATGRITAKGLPVIYHDATRHRVGQVLPGGSVSLTGFLNLAPLSIIDVSGASGVIDLPGGLQGISQSITPVVLASDGGSISLSKTGLIAGQLVAQAGGPGAAAGTLRINGPEGSSSASPAPDNPRQALLDAISGMVGFDFAEWVWDGTPPGPMIVSQEMVDALPTSASASSGLIVSETAAAPEYSSAATMEQFGWTQAMVDLANANFIFFEMDMAGLFATTGTRTLVVRPGSINNGGFANVMLNSGTNVLEGATIAAQRSISIQGAILNGNGQSSTLIAPHVALNGLAAAASVTAGTLKVQASLIDIGQAAVRGFAKTELAASDIRMVGVQVGTNFEALLDVDGTLELLAGQVYPGTAVKATVKAADRIVVSQNGTAGLPYSAGGDLILEAPLIEQNGTLRAPFGTITLKAATTLTLGDGSLTSVSGAGLVVPYGFLQNGEEWLAPDATTDANGLLISLAAPPEKRIVLDAPVVDEQSGATIDIRGGGDLYAKEFVPGPGGSHDLLAMSGVYAILPSDPSAAAPVSPITRTGATNLAAVGNRIWLAGGNGLAPGWYTLLPAEYALLPGAMAVQVVAGSEGRTPTTSTVLPDGTIMMAGRLGNVLDGSSQSLSSTWRVMSGGVVRSYTEYNEATANAFFSSETFRLTRYRLRDETITAVPRLPMDGGALVLKATQQLILDGQLQAEAAAGGRGGLVDIAAPRLAVVGAGHDTDGLSGYLILDPERLGGFGSLLLGGVRSGVAQGMRVDVTATDIIVRNDAGSALTGPELILTASDNITIADGSVLRAEGEIGSGGGDLIMAQAESGRDYGAVVRLSNGDAISVRRTNVDVTVGGTVSIGTDVVLDGGNALMIDATRNTILAGSAQVSGKNIALGGSRIGFGGGTEGLVFDAAALARFAAAQSLTLRSYSTIDFHAGIDFGSVGLASVTLDAGALVGLGSGSVAITGDTIVLRNTGDAIADPGVVGQGMLSMNANELVLGEGAKALRGFSTVMLTGTNGIVGEGKGTLDVGAASMTLSTPLLTGRNTANQALTTAGSLSLVATGGSSTLAAPDSLGSILSLTGRDMTVSGAIVALGGAVNLKSTNGSVTLADGATVNVGGLAKQFFDVAEYADAGRISLTALGGSVLIGQGATLDLAAHSGGGGAGTLSVTTDGGNVTLGGAIKAQAAAGERGGSFSLDIATLADFGALNRRLNDAGFSKSREFRIRSGDVMVDGTTVVEAFTLTADQGRVTIAGMIDARATYGGEIEIYGGNGLTVANTAVLRALATDSVDNLGSGRVTLGISNGTLVVQGGLIDVSGGEGGKVTLRAPVIEQAGANTVNVAFAGGIAGAREIVLEGYKRFDLADLADLATHPDFVGVTINGSGQAELDLAATAAGKLNVLADFGAGTLVEFVQDFDVSGAYGALGGLASQANFHARPGMQLDYAGDIVLKSNWNLGAGIVDEAGAIAAGVMAVDPLLNKPYVIAGRQSDLLADHTTMVYRTGGSIFGEPGSLTLRAGGDLVLDGSITDGFFQFADPLDVDYVSKAGSKVYEYARALNGGFNSGSGTTTLTSWANYVGASGLPSVYLGLAFGIDESVYWPSEMPRVNVPYSAAGNSPAAKGTLAGGAGDALRYAELFPAVTASGGATVAPASWSLALAAGAAPAGQSANPMQLAAGSSGSVILNEQPSFTYTMGGDGEHAGVRSGTITVDATTSFDIGSGPAVIAGTMSAEEWLAYATGFSGVSDSSTAVITLGRTGRDPAADYILGLWNNFADNHNLVQGSADPTVGYVLMDSASSGRNIIAPVATFEAFMTEQIIPNLAAIESQYAFNATPPAVPVSNVTSRPLTVVRTGTGDINVASARDVILRDAGAIYTAGRRDTTTFSDFVQKPRYFINTNLQSNPIEFVLPDPVYAIDGGHVSITAGGNVQTVIPDGEGQLFTQWLLREGDVDGLGVFAPHADPLQLWSGTQRLQFRGQQSAWWVDHAAFQHGVAALGGGNLSISAGGDIIDLTAVLATNGRVRGGRSDGEAKSLELRNGGAMTVTAAGSIRGGQYYIGRGEATIAAAELTTGRTLQVRLNFNTGFTSYQFAPVLALGDATMGVTATGNLTIQTVADPLMMPMAYGIGVQSSALDYGAYMSGYTDRTAIALTSVTGDISVGGQTDHLSRSYDDTLNPKPSNFLVPFARDGANLYPSKTSITALNGSVTNGFLRTMPGPTADLRILAGEDVLPGTILMARNMPADFPTPFRPRHGFPWQDLGISHLIVGTDRFGNVIDNPEHLVQESDHEPSRIYALHGSISNGTITANEQLWMRAGANISRNTLDLRNLHPSDVSWLDAGQDIISGAGAASQETTGRINIQGPGTLLLTAGRDVFGTELYIYSTGNRAYDALFNQPIPDSEIRGLPSTGASIEVIAGLNGQQPDYEAFAAAYLDPAQVAAMPDHLKTTLPDGTVVPLYLTDDDGERDGKQIRLGLVSFIAEMTGETLLPLEAWARFQALPEATRQVFVRRVYMQELRAAGRDQNGGLLSGGYNRGYEAIEKLFPGDDWSGSVLAGSALFRTMGGGDIRIMTPGGGLQVAALGTPVQDGYGLVTLGYGNIDIFAKRDVVVNRSRILTFAGGDEIIWSTLGDIDAGRGAKTARVPSRPEILTDSDGVTRIVEQADIAGSGIGTIIGYSGVKPGDIDLIAPFGTVNAGDAGIRVSGDLNLAALHVANAANIDVGGESKGIPEIKAPDISGLTEASNAAGAASQGATSPAQSGQPTEQPSIIIVEVIGYGGGDATEPESEEEERARKKKKDQRSSLDTYDPNSMFRVVGSGELTDQQKESLTAEERAK